MPQIPYVRSGEKLHITAKTLNAVAEHINGAVTISAGKPNKGGGGGGSPTPTPVVVDNYVDMFKVTHNTTDNRIYVSGGVIVNGTTIINCNAYNFSSRNAGSLRYIVLYVSYNNSTQQDSATITENNTSVIYPTSNTGFLLTLASVYWDTATSCTITLYRCPSPVYIQNRWS